MDHVVIPIGRDHTHTIDLLVAGAAAAAGIDLPPAGSSPHVTLVAYSGLSRTVALREIRALVMTLQPFALHAHGYGFFAGDDPTDLSLHVQVVRTRLLDALHAGVCDRLARVGADIAPWSAPDVWSPHITLIDRALDPVRLGAAVAWLSRRHHPSWTISVDRAIVTGGWRDRQHGDDSPIDMAAAVDLRVPPSGCAPPARTIAG